MRLHQEVLLLDGDSSIKSSWSLSSSSEDEEEHSDSSAESSAPKSSSLFQTGLTRLHFLKTLKIAYLKKKLIGNQEIIISKNN